MNKITTLFGWPERSEQGDPRGALRVLSAVDADGQERQEQSSVFIAAKEQHRFPKGVRVLGYQNSETPGIQIATHISDEVGDLIVDRQKYQAKAEAAAKEKANAAQKRRDEIVKAHKKLTEAALTWNAKRDLLSLAKRTLADVEANAKFSEAFKSKVEPAKKAVAEAEKVETAAKAEYESAKAAKAELVNPPKHSEPKKETTKK